MPIVFTALALLSLFPTAMGSVERRRPAGPATTVPTANPVEGLYDALSRCRPSLSEAERWQIAGAIHRESEHFGYDPFFVLAMMEIESTCSPTARGPNGGVGLIQVTEATGRAIARVADLPWHGADTLIRPVANLHIGLRYLAELEEQFSDPTLAVAAYNMGPARVARMPRQRARSARYVRKILARYEVLLTHLTVGST